MFVIKRDGKQEQVVFDKITARIQKMTYGLDERFVDSTFVAHRVIEDLFDGVTTEALDRLAAEIAAILTSRHPDYAILAGRLALSNLHKTTPSSFSEAVKKLYLHPTQQVSHELYSLAEQWGDRIDAEIQLERDLVTIILDLRHPNMLIF